jgi:DNA-binding XRE family transcriptional regulator
MTAATTTSPIGTSASDAARARARRNPEYRAEQARLSQCAEIAAQLILFRTEQGLTQEQLAERVGTSHSAISRLESGQHSASFETLRRVAHALGHGVRITFEPLSDDAVSSRVETHSRGRELAHA